MSPPGNDDIRATSAASGDNEQDIAASTSHASNDEKLAVRGQNPAAMARLRRLSKQFADTAYDDVAEKNIEDSQQMDRLLAILEMDPEERAELTQLIQEQVKDIKDVQERAAMFDQWVTAVLISWNETSLPDPPTGSNADA